LQQASTQSAINEKALEKDLWVTLVLRAVFKTKYAPYLHFKGGTSLSKAWQVIDRFSEDIDLSIDRSFYGFTEELLYPNQKAEKDFKCIRQYGDEDGLGKSLTGNGSA